MRREQGHGPDADTRRLTRRGLLLGAGVAAFLAACAPLYRHVSSTSAIRVESFTSPGSGRSRNILVLTGSARPGGNSELLADAFVRGARAAGHAVNVFECGKNPMSACLHCDNCWTTGTPCVVDDSFSALWPLLEQADMLVLCSPLYWYNFSGHIKCVIDRLYPYSRKNRLRDMPVKEAMLLMCGESLFPRSFAGAAEAYRQMLGLKRWKDRGRLFVTGVHEMGAMAGHRALATAEDMGRNA
ncbi:MAG: flavodoxin family protein [Desulfovibrionaceae bacterium]|nr:flavodoxin family protein [Desulfovibrionaceae bacterium]